MKFVFSYLFRHSIESRFFINANEEPGTIHGRCLTISSQRMWRVGEVRASPEHSRKEGEADSLLGFGNASPERNIFRKVFSEWLKSDGRRFKDLPRKGSSREEGR